MESWIHKKLIRHLTRFNKHRAILLSGVLYLIKNYVFCCIDTILVLQTAFMAYMVSRWVGLTREDSLVLLGSYKS